MTDMEKSIKGLLEIADWHYGKYEQTHEEDYLNDGDFLTAVANMLKAQEPVEPKKVNRYIDFDGEGHPYNPETYDCGACGKELPWKAKYCPECARRVKWE